MATEVNTSLDLHQENVENIPENDPDCEPEPKKRKIIPRIENEEYKLEEKLNGILCCAVCLDLPNVAVYQVGFHDKSHYLYHIWDEIMKICT